MSKQKEIIDRSFIEKNIALFERLRSGDFSHLFINATLYFIVYTDLHRMLADKIHLPEETLWGETFYPTMLIMSFLCGFGLLYSFISFIKYYVRSFILECRFCLERIHHKCFINEYEQRRKYQEEIDFYRENCVSLGYLESYLMLNPSDSHINKIYQDALESIQIKSLAYSDYLVTFTLILTEFLYKESIIYSFNRSIVKHELGMISLLIYLFYKGAVKGSKDINFIYIPVQKVREKIIKSRDH